MVKGGVRRVLFLARGCTACECPQGTTYESGNNSCSLNCTTPCTTWNGTSCVPVTCGANINCNPNVPSNEECQCNIGSIPNSNGAGCVACPSCTTNNAELYSMCMNAATACQKFPNTYCDPSQPVTKNVPVIRVLLGMGPAVLTRS